MVGFSLFFIFLQINLKQFKHKTGKNNEIFGIYIQD